MVTKRHLHPHGMHFFRNTAGCQGPQGCHRTKLPQEWFDSGMAALHPVRHAGSRTTNAKDTVYRLLLICLAWLTCTATGFAQQINVQWSPSDRLNSVRMATGAMLNVKNEDPSFFLGKRLELKSASGQVIYDRPPVKDDHVDIRRAYPNATEARAVFLTTACGGNSCEKQDIWVAYLVGAGVHVHRLGSTYTRATKISLDLSTPEHPQIFASDVNLVDGDKDRVGDYIAVERKLLPGKGFVDPAVTAEYLSLIGEHPENFFSDQRLRKAVLSKIGPDGFRALRGHFQVASAFSIYEGRYLNTAGFGKSPPTGRGALILDAISGSYWAVLEGDAPQAIQHSPWPSHLLDLAEDQLLEGKSVAFEKAGLRQRKPDGRASTGISSSASSSAPIPKAAPPTAKACDTTAAARVHAMLQQMGAQWSESGDGITFHWSDTWDVVSATQRIGLLHAFANGDACLTGRSREIYFYRSGRLVGRASVQSGIRLVD